MLNVTGLDHPAIAVEDPDAMAQWYMQVLGYKKHSRIDKADPVWLLEAADGSFLEVMPKDETPRPERTTWAPGWSHLALRVTNLKAAIDYLTTNDVTWLGDICDAVGGGKLRSFEDPEGNMWQVVQR